MGIIHRRRHSLEQANFLMSLAETLSSHERMCLDAWRILREYPETPKKMDESEWNTVIHALEDCYESATFLFKISQLVNKKLVDMDLLYLFYFDRIIKLCGFKLSTLIRWCGTGLDLAVNYDPYTLVPIVKGVRELIIALHHVHKQHGGQLEWDIIIPKRSDERMKDFLADPARFDLVSDNYVDNFVSVQE